MNVQKFKKTLDDIKDAEVVHGGAITAYALGRLQ
jgi:hypothetical protein